MSETILRGGISYNEGEFVYTWHSEDGSCEKCEALDGQRFTNPEDIPNRPHPNCRCWVEVSDRNNNGNGWGNGSDEGNGGYDIDYLNSDEPEEDELCDCWREYLEYIDDSNEIIGSANSLKDEILVAINNISRYLQEKFAQPIKSKIENIIDNLEQIYGAVCDFTNNYNDMKEANTIGADKYFHSKANCQASQRGELGTLTAKSISDLRELTDSFKNVYIKGMTEIESAKDSAEDQRANVYGRVLGAEYPDADCGDLVDIYRPNGLPSQY